MVVGLNKLPIAIAGIVIFDVPVTFYSITAVVIGSSHSRNNADSKACVLVSSTLLQSLHNRMELSHKYPPNLTARVSIM